MLTADVCVQKETGQVRLLQGSQSCLSQENSFVWTVGGEVTEIVGDEGVTAERRDDTVSLGIDSDVVQAKVIEACGDGTDGSAIAAAGSTSLSLCQTIERAGMLPNVQQSTSLEIELPPGKHRALPGNGEEFVGSPLTWRINKSARKDDVWSYYQGSVRAIVQHKDPSSSGWRRATQFLRYFSSSGSSGHFQIDHDLNPENEDFGIFTFGFTQEVRLVIVAAATPCTWSQIGGQVAIERIG